MVEKAPIIITAGGTGGHVFPAQALAEELIARGERVVFITDKRSKAYMRGVLEEVENYSIHAGTLNKGLRGKIIGVVNLLRGLWEARALLARLQPKAVVGFGGYPSFPTMQAAMSRGVKTIIHEQNAVLGRANRLLASKVDVIACSFVQTRRIEAGNAAKVVHTGNPVRASIRALHSVPYPQLNADAPLQLLVTGGSQGASVFGEVVPEALALLPLPLRKRLRVDQQCREADIERVRARYDALGISHHLAVFFNDMPAKLASAHLVIARAGASTVSELQVAGRPAILVPLPTAMDNHQAMNADAFEDAGSGWVMLQEGFTPQALASRLEAFLSAPVTLINAAEASRTSAKLRAAEQLADLV
jgi:UDP-N-acetylglucosamine--N-acetylmuramyl-(pentapeptide) pyrophosphoryl-undecaprenol N-acetylglucosamine transferase